MKINDFIKGYTELSNQELKQNYMSSLLVKSYIPYEVKITYAQKCIKEHFADNGLVITNTPMAYLKYTMAVLDLFTTLELDYSVEAYDALQEYGLIDQFMNLLRDDLNYAEFKTIYNMCESDFRTNTLSPRGFIQHQLQRLCEMLNENLSTLAQELKGVDLKELMKNLKK